MLVNGAAQIEETATQLAVTLGNSNYRQRSMLLVILLITEAGDKYFSYKGKQFHIKRLL
jgi:hypothetical protein